MMSDILNPEELELLAAGYVLNDLDETEQAQVQELIRTNTGMREQIRQSMTIMGILATNVPQKCPPENLKNKITQAFETQFSALKKTNLDNWFQEIFEAGWQTTAELLGNQTLSPAFRNVGVTRGKIITIQPDSISIILIVKITKTSSVDRDVIVEILPSSEQQYLPSQLKISILDKDGNEAIQATTRQDNKNIKFEFSGSTQEAFTVKLSLSNNSIKEEFVI